MQNKTLLPAKKILVVKLADLGDALAITPALRALREAYPQAKIEALLAPPAARVLHNSPLLDNIITFDKFALDSPLAALNPRLVWKALSFLRSLRQGKYDTVVIFHHFSMRWGTLKFALFALATGAQWRVGLDNGRGWFLNRRYLDRGFGAEHDVDYWRHVVATIGGGTRPINTEIIISTEDREEAKKILTSFLGAEPTAGGPLIVIHPFAGWYAPIRRWPLENFASLIDSLTTAHRARVVIIGAPDEKKEANELPPLLKGAQPLLLVGETSLGQTSAIIELADLFIGNDSGPMHIAAATGTPVIAIFGPTNHRAWGPYVAAISPDEESQSPLAGKKRSNRALVVRQDLPCSPCMYRGFSVGTREGCPERPCLTTLSPDLVLSAVEDILGIPSI